MIYFKIVLLFVFICFSTSCNTVKEVAKKKVAEPVLVITNVHVIDAKNGLRRNRTVKVSGNRITQVVSSQETVAGSADQVIDGTGKYLIPGLWDAHVHLSFEEDLTPAMFRLFLAHGITSIRDTGGQLPLVLPEREKSRQNPKNTPRVMIAGPLLDGVPTVYDGSSAFNPHLGLGAANVAEAERIADDMIEAETDLLKAYEMLRPEDFLAILKKAKEAGIPVTGHVPLSMDVIEASEAGLNSMEHMRNLEMSCSGEWQTLLEGRKKMLAKGTGEPGSILRGNIHRAQRIRAVETQDPKRREKVLKTLAENQTWQVPTLSIMTAAAERFFLRPDWQDSFSYLPATVAQRWRTGLEAFSATPLDKASVIYANWLFEMVGHCKKAGVTIMAGTDCPIFYLTPGYSLHEELVLLVQGGLSPLEALAAATIHPATYFKLERELGLIEPGMLADLVLLSDNPLENIRNTRKIEAVIRDGKLHNRADLDGLLKPISE